MGQLPLPVREGIQKELPQFDLYTDFAVRMKARSKAVQTFVVQFAMGRAPQPPADAGRPQDPLALLFQRDLPAFRAGRQRRADTAPSFKATWSAPKAGSFVEETLKMINAMF